MGITNIKISSCDGCGKEESISSEDYVGHKIPQGWAEVTITIPPNKNIGEFSNKSQTFTICSMDCVGKIFTPEDFSSVSPTSNRIESKAKSLLPWKRG